MDIKLCDKCKKELVDVECGGNICIYDDLEIISGYRCHLNDYIWNGFNNISDILENKRRGNCK